MLRALPLSTCVPAFSPAWVISLSQPFPQSTLLEYEAKEEGYLQSVAMPT